MEDRRRRTTAPRAKKPSAKRAPTQPTETGATQSHTGSCGPQRGARSRRAERDGDTTEKPRAPAPRARPGRATVRIKDAQPSATDAAGATEPPAVPVPQRQDILDLELPAMREPQRPAEPEAPNIVRGPSHRRGARSTGPLRAPRGSRKEPDKLKKVLDNLRLKREKISVAAKTVNKVVDHLLRRMQNRESEFKGVEQLNTGSYYEHVKISAPNEFDVMFKLEVPRIELEEYGNTGAFYLVKFKRYPRGNPLRHFLEGEFLSATKMLSKFRKIIKEEVKEIKDIDVSVEKKKPGSPAVTLLIRNPEVISVDIILALESKGSWPISTKEGLPIQGWLGTKVRTNLRREPFFLVPKNAKDGNGFQGETWRLSFSHTE
ncbi:cyclic GMP-AMP synthase-like, partial [Mastomys coucha]|uniref:cyclic GMP-AMP synthase-like n=1 Tax=Mastomys coucha TaxID=35658 RepID=UPI00126198C5